MTPESGQSMSRRHEIQFTPEEQAAFLSQPHEAALATIDKEGFPRVVAMGYRYKDGVIYRTSYGIRLTVVRSLEQISPLSSRNVQCVTKITLRLRCIGQPNAQ
jgi:pyridoxamine 5'-phosphate oxidase-like protein